ncbi:MAG: ABC transporter permease [Candidatus Symbiobacter sp.]|nr:ABC transporter permease [Candidatus Symbiobacter sp.]
MTSRSDPFSDNDQASLAARRMTRFDAANGQNTPPTFDQPKSQTEKPRQRAWLAGVIWGVIGLLLLWLILAIWPEWLNDLLQSKKTFLNAMLSGITLAGLYFLVASGFTLVFGLMRNVNLAHGSLYLLGAYIGLDVADATQNWYWGVVGGTLSIAALGVVMQVFIFRRLEGDELRQTLVTIGLSILAADIMLAIWGGHTSQFTLPEYFEGAVTTPIITAINEDGSPIHLTYPLYRLVVLAVAGVIGVGLWLVLAKTRLGMMIRAGVEDRAMLAASGVNVGALFAAVFALGAGLAGLAGVVGASALSISPGEDVRYLLASLVVVIVGSMGSILGAAIGALLIGIAEQVGLVYFPTYGIVLTFLIMVVTLAVRPQGLMGGKSLRLNAAAPPRPARQAPADAEFSHDDTAENPPHHHAVWGGLGLALVLLLAPLYCSEFVLFQVGSQTLILGMIGLSLMVLAGYGGMVSLAQLMLAGIAGYVVAIFGPNAVGVWGLNWPWWVVIPLAIILSGLAAMLVGMLAVRTLGIYTIMITLAIATAFFYFCQQNYTLFNGFAGYRGVAPPAWFDMDWRAATPFYYLCLAVACLAFFAVVYLARTPFGLALMAVRDNPRRMSAVGFNVTHIRILAYGLSGIIAGAAGVLYVWFNGRISPGTISVAETISILVITVIGGMRHPLGPFLGSLLYIILKTFAIDVVGADRFNSLIGVVFLAIVLVSPDGLLGLSRFFRSKFSAATRHVRSL